MQYTCLEIQEKVLEALQNDPELASYVKKFDIGEENVSRKFFPYITVASVTEQVEPLCIGPGAPDLHRYRIVIQGGTNSMLAETARAGNDSGKKGIVHLMDDIVASLYPGNLKGIFKSTLHLLSATHEEVQGTAGRSWKTSVILTGIRKV